MLENLKQQVRNRYASDVVFEAVNETPDEVKDALLADEEAHPMPVDPEVSETEEDEDPQINSLIENLPETEEDDATEYSEEEMDSIIESFIRL